MDPRANIEEQVALAREIAEHGEGAAYSGDAQRLAELVLALDEWRCGGGFDPYVGGGLFEPTGGGS